MDLHISWQLLAWNRVEPKLVDKLAKDADIRSYGKCLGLWPLWLVAGFWILLVICVKKWNERINYRNDLLAIRSRIEQLKGQLIDVREVERRYVRSGRSRHRRSSCYHATYVDETGQCWKILLYAYCGWAGQTDNWQIGEVHRVGAADHQSDPVDQHHPVSEAAGSGTHRGERPADVPVIFLARHHHQPPAADSDHSGPRRRRREDD